MATTSRKGAAAKAAETVEPDLPDEVLSTTEAVEAIVEPALEMQESVRNVLQKGAVETRAAFAKAKASAEDAASAFELSFAAAKDGVVAFNAKAFAAARANAEANFDFLKASMAIRSIPDRRLAAGIRPQADRRRGRAVHRPRRIGEEDRGRDLRADQGSGDEGFQDRGLIRQG